MLTILHPPTFLPERNYIFDVIFDQFLGIEYRAIVHDKSDVRIRLNGDTVEKELRVADIFFHCPIEEWLTRDSLPKRPLERCDTSEFLTTMSFSKPEIPVIFGNRINSFSFIEEGENTLSIGIDIFGSAFFMLTRYEEAVLKIKDNRERFPSSGSLAYKEGFLDRPIINEYLEILWWGINRLWPAISRLKREYKLVLSHDVDRPFGIHNRSLFQILKSMGGDLLLRKDGLLALRRIISTLKVKSGNLDADLHNTFHFIMDLSEACGIKSSFYFIVDHSAGIIDGNYSLHHPWMRKLLREIHTRGHEIGLHPGYYTFRDKNKIAQQFKFLIHQLETQGITQMEWGGRQHYLRWEVPLTWQGWEEAGLSYDSTLGYADHAGFRCGVCYEFSVFNLHTRQPLRLRERPLIAMEGSLLDSGYMGLTIDEALEVMRKLRNECKRFNGEFTLLWHNSSLIKKDEMDLYQLVVKESVKSELIK